MSIITQGAKDIYKDIKEMLDAGAIDPKGFNDIIDSAMNETEVEFEAKVLAQQGLDATTIGESEDTKFDRDYDQIVKAKLENVKEEYRKDNDDIVDFTVEEIKSLKAILKDAFQLNHLESYESTLGITSDFENNLATTMTENVRVGWGKVRGKNILVTPPVILESKEAKKLIETRFTPLLEKVHYKVREKYQAFKKKDNFEKAVEKLDALWRKKRTQQSIISMFTRSKVVSNPERIQQAISAIIEGKDVDPALSDGFSGSGAFTKAIKEFKEAYEGLSQNNHSDLADFERLESAMKVTSNTSNSDTHSNESGSTDNETNSSNEQPIDFKTFLNNELNEKHGSRETMDLRVDN